MIQVIDLFIFLQSVNLPSDIPIWLAVVVAITIALIYNIKNLMRLSHKINERFSSYTISKSEKKTAKMIRDRLTDARTELQDQLDFDILPLDFQIKWHNRKTSPHLNNENEVVIVLNEDEKSLTENFVLSVYQYSSLGVLHDARKYLFPNITSAIDLTITKKIINAKKQDGLDFFENKILQKEIDKNITSRNYIDTLITLDQSGLFTRIFLNELNEYGKRLDGTLPNNYIKIDTEKYMEYFKTLAYKKTNKDMDIQFVKGSQLQIGIVLIAGMYLKHNSKQCYKDPLSTPYGKHIKKLINNDVNSIYLIARGEKFCKFAEHILDNFEQNIRVDYVKKQKYSLSNTLAFVGLIRLKLKIK